MIREDVKSTSEKTSWFQSIVTLYKDHFSVKHTHTKKFWILGQIPVVLSKQCRPRSDCSSRSSLIRVYTVCHSICIYSTVKPVCSIFRTSIVIILWCISIPPCFSTISINSNSFDTSCLFPWMTNSFQKRVYSSLNLIALRRAKTLRVLVVLSVIGLRKEFAHRVDTSWEGRQIWK